MLRLGRLPRVDSKEMGAFIQALVPQMHGSHFLAGPIRDRGCCPSNRAFGIG